MGDRAFYEEHWRQRGGKLQHNPLVLDKIRRILAYIPADVKTVLDVGCGDGAITNELARHYEVTAIDRSIHALHHVSDRATVLCMDAAHIDLSDHFADLVHCSEMLEHVTPAAFAAVIGHLERLARRYLLISVPNREELGQRRTRCQHCGKEFHIYRHLRRFTLRKLARLFPAWDIRATFVCGARETPTLGFVSAMRNRLVRSYFYGIEGETPCPRCGQVIHRKPLNVAQRAASAALNRFEAILLRALHRRPHPDWLVVLLSR